jgi:hypothetical protein
LGEKIRKNIENKRLVNSAGILYREADIISEVINSREELHPKKHCDFIRNKFQSRATVRLSKLDTNKNIFLKNNFLFF